MLLEMKWKERPYIIKSIIIYNFTISTVSTEQYIARALLTSSSVIILRLSLLHKKRNDVFFIIWPGARKHLRTAYELA